MTRPFRYLNEDPRDALAEEARRRGLQITRDHRLVLANGQAILWDATIDVVPLATEAIDTLLERLVEARSELGEYEIDHREFAIDVTDLDYIDREYSGSVETPRGSLDFTARRTMLTTIHGRQVAVYEITQSSA